MEVLPCVRPEEVLIDISSFKLCMLYFYLSAIPSEGQKRAPCSPPGHLTKNTGSILYREVKQSEKKALIVVGMI